TKLIWIDPENKNVYMTKKFGGTFINWGVPGNQINIFDLKPISSDDENIKLYDTETAIYNAIDDIKMILKLYHYNIKESLHEALNEIDPIVVETYKRKGITFDLSFKGLPLSSYPTFSDLNCVLLEEMEKSDNKTQKDLLYKLLSAIKPLINSHKNYFDGVTTINENNKNDILSFGTKSLKEKDQGLKDSLNYIMFRYAWSKCLNLNEDTAFVLDEAHEMILEGVTAKELASIYRRSRKYNNCAVIGTQEPRDLSSDVLIDGVVMNVHGKSILNNSTYKIIMMLEKAPVESLGEMIALNTNEMYSILDYVRGEALFICGNKKYEIEVLASEKELKEMDPTRN
ncbi:MAG: hypothetical protein WBO70_02060, partial [Erysipelotrichaceae bacterium]